jgi:uncharacterized membrane protein (UPF0182 family)
MYIGENLTDFVIVGTNRDEIDYQDEDGETQFAPYEGADGVGIGSFVRRAAFALRFGDPNMLFSGNLRSGSRILYQRDVSERVSALAPFLDFDSDPYPVVVDGRIQWIVDAYTTTSRYPYAQRAVLDGLGGSDLDHRFNYIRNSVKAVVDAYDGSVTFYVVDQEDPIIRAYMQAFPDLFTTDPAPEELRAHFRYPENLFRVQSNMWGRYHIDDDQPDDFFNNVGTWTVAPDPGEPTQQPANTTTSTTNPGAPPTEAGRIAPYYLFTRLPGEEDDSFVLLRPFVPVRGSRPVLTGFLVANSDPDEYGTLVSYETPPTESVRGPSVIAGTINSDPEVSEDQTVLCQQGADCEFGALQFVPIGDSLLYVQPLYIIADQNPVPLLRKVIVEFNGRVGYADTLREALLQIFDEVPETLEDPGGPSTDDPGDDEEEPPEETDVAALLDEAEQLFAEAEAALRDPDGPDFATYEARIEEARDLIEQARAALAAESGSGSGSTTTTTAPASTTTTTEPESA